MDTANSLGYADDRYDDALDALHKQNNNLRNWIEPAIIFMAIISYCAVMAMMQNRDQASKNQALAEEISKLKAPKSYTCLLTQNNVIHQYPNCQVIADKYVRVN